MNESDPLLVRLARRQLESGRMPSGIATLRRWCGKQHDPGRRAQRRRRSAELLSQHGQHHEALAHLSAALAGGPRDPVVHYQLLAEQAATFNALGWHAEALEAAKHSLRIEPVHLAAIRERGVAHAGLGQALEAYRWLAMALANVYRDDGALPHLERLVATHGAQLKTIYPDLDQRLRRLRRWPLPELSILTERRRMEAPGTPDEFSRPSGPVMVEVMIEDLMETARFREAELIADEHIAAATTPGEALSRCCNAALSMSRCGRTVEMDRYLNRMQQYEYEDPHLFALMQGLIAQCLMVSDRREEALRHAKAAVEAYPIDDYAWKLLWQLIEGDQQPLEKFHALRRSWVVMGCVNPNENSLEKWIEWKGPDEVRNLPHLGSYIAEFRKAVRARRERYAEYVGKKYTLAEHHALYEAWEAEADAQ